MRSLCFLALVLPLALAGCFDTHGVGGDAGPLVGDGGVCGGTTSLFCVSACGSDARIAPVCDGNSGWSCPPGTRDRSTCPPAPNACPPDINPWNPMDPHSQCSPEGITCQSGGNDSCGSFMRCDCESGHWNCLVAEADPVCWCGRQPSEGDRCNTEGMSCGECCPTPGGTGWPAMQCSGGHWTGAACPAIECQPIAVICPVEPQTLIGASCASPGATCGDPCCEAAAVCTGGTWALGPIANCAVCTEYACGPGHCRADQTCTLHCGPADGGLYECAPRDVGCNDCSCIPTSSAEHCEMIDGHPHVSVVGFCG